MPNAMKTPKTIGEAIADTMKTGRRWSLKGFPGLQLGTPEDFRNHCMERIKHWKNSDTSIAMIKAQFDVRFRNKKR